MKRIALLLALTMLASALLISCGDAGSAAGTPAANEGKDVQEAAETEAETTVDAFSAARAALPDVDYEGYEFLFAGRSDSLAWATIDIVAEEQNGDAINDAIYTRNTEIAEKMNVVIKMEECGMTPSDTVYKSVLAGDDTYDCVTDGLNKLASDLAANGAVLDFETIPGIDLTADCWDSALTSGLSIGGKVYFVTGDISIMDNYGTWCLLFNKDILRNYQLDDPYQLVNDGAWTFDVMAEMISKVGVDLDGDGKMGDWDQYGLLTENFNTYGFWSTSGEKIVSKDKSDMPQLALYNARSASVIEKVTALQSDESCVMQSDRHQKTNVPSGVDPVDLMFKTGYSMFIFGGMWLISDYRSSEVDFGILPAPKFDESQDSYYSTYSYCNCTALSVPMTVSDAQRTGDVLQAMAVLSKVTLTPAYVETSLQGKFLRDEESAGMIDIVLETRNFDLGTIFNWGGCYDIFSTLYKEKSSDLSSKYDANEAKIEAAIADFCSSIQ